MNDFFTSPELLYAVKNNITVESILVEIFKVDKSTCSSLEAKRYFTKTLELANAGSPLAMCLCVGFYTNGWGVPKSDSNALKFAKKAADIHFAPGIFELGVCYEKGIGVERDNKLAISCYVTAAESGYGHAAFYLATLYRDGKMVDKDYEKSIQYAELAFELGESLAAGFLVDWYEDEKNFEKAVFWCKRGAECGNPFLSLRLSNAYQFGLLGLSKDQELAEKYMDMFEKQGTES